MAVAVATRLVLRPRGGGQCWRTLALAQPLACHGAPRLFPSSSFPARRRRRQGRQRRGRAAPVCLRLPHLPRLRPFGGNAPFAASAGGRKEGVHATCPRSAV